MSGNESWNSGGGEPSQPSQPAPPPGDAPPPYYAPPAPPESPNPGGTPPPYMQAPPPPPPKPKSGLRRLLPLIVLLVIAAVVIGGFLVFRDRAPNDVTSLAPGECFDEPTDQAEVSQVQRQPCNVAHDAEVIAALTHPAPAGEPYPVVSGFDDYIQQNCLPVFEAYVGNDSEVAVDYDIGYFQPTLSGWSEGQRQFTCYVSRSDGQKMTNTVHVSGSSPAASQAAPSL